jgi:hypothetical protein
MVPRRPVEPTERRGVQVLHRAGHQERGAMDIFAGSNAKAQIQAKGRRIKHGTPVAREERESSWA